MLTFLTFYVFQSFRNLPRIRVFIQLVMLLFSRCMLIVTFFLVVSRIIFLNSFSLIVEKKDGSNQAAIESCLVQ